VRFEEVNHELELSFSYEWNSSDLFGFVRKAELKNLSDTQKEIQILDGLQNIMPSAVGENLQVQRSNLVDAYKRNELVPEVGLGIYALSAVIVDKAEPSEALKANVAWHMGLPNPTYLVSSLQLNQFRKSGVVDQEVDIKAERGAYLVASEFKLQAAATCNWIIGVNVNLDQSAISMLIKNLSSPQSLQAAIEEDVLRGSQKLKELVAASDGIQYSADRLRDTRHYSNTLFNIMRGGIFDNNYQIERWDFRNYIRKGNKEVYGEFQDFIFDLPEVFTVQHLIDQIEDISNMDFKRLCYEYLPLKFSRRHGDPSRPWNRFSINTRSEIDGSKVLDYEGNWRDIFQNWEALAHAYPPFVEGMIHKFLNATTFDGYNPYRITKDGFDWEVIEEHDPWSYIGYWGDHQIIYLLKFLEIIEGRYPGQLANYFNQDFFVYANVPYKIKPYKDVLKNPKDTIDFDYALDHNIRAERKKIGADGALIKDQNGHIHHVNFLEKILATVLAKVSNFIIEGGIWMNTQRPEWNDANNALVGNGVSMVTLCYLRRFIRFMSNLLDPSAIPNVKVSAELLTFFNRIHAALAENKAILTRAVSDTDRKRVLDLLGMAASDYRSSIYKNDFSGKKEDLKLSEIKDLTRVLLEYLDHSIAANQREDGMYHAYNLMSVTNEGVSISYLDEMLEGQVAVLSSGYLSSDQALKVLDGLKNSTLFRPDQYSYLLYPNKELPGFLERNSVDLSDLQSSKLLSQLITDGEHSVIKKDVFGGIHFNGNFNNMKDLKEALDTLRDSAYKDLVDAEEELVLGIFEKVFNHKAFTGRSGTFYGYEGLGSIYWHMVSKLQLAVLECCVKAIENGESEVIIGKLLEHYYEINEGIGVHKSPSLYGAFPTDPYSHTPFTKGAQQPGMTGQVKEDILSRIGELGVFVKDGRIHFNPTMLREDEFIKEEKTYTVIDVNNRERNYPLHEGMMAFTYCQVPVIYKLSSSDAILIADADGTEKRVEGTALDMETSQEVFDRTGTIDHIIVEINKAKLK
jgi:hypothetical protein